MKKGVVLLLILLLVLGCVSEERVESPSAETEVLNISFIIEHIGEYEGKEVEIIGRSRGEPVLIGEIAYADIADATGRVILIFNPESFLHMAEVRDGDKMKVKGIFKTSKDSDEDLGKTVAHMGAPYFLEPSEILMLS